MLLFMEAMVARMQQAGEFVVPYITVDSFMSEEQIGKVMVGDTISLEQVLYVLAHSSLKPEFSIEYTVKDVVKCKNGLLHNAIEDSVQKAQVLTTAANVKHLIMCKK